MAYDDYLAERIRNFTEKHLNYFEKKMMGGFGIYAQR